ncbi:hypothetical protein L7F22_017632 [Adiantum nelumboides]|nr:hypothetical protein [Adiantum nelumboides]
MPIKRARQEETTDNKADTRRKTKESEKSNKKKKTKPRQKLTIKDFALGESSQPYDLVDDVSMQGPKISWPQLLYLSPKVCRQWSKMGGETTAEKDYTAVEHMVMALMFAVGKFRPYLLPKKFVILTLKEKFPLVLQHMDVSACISKWLVRLQEFEYIVQVENSTRANLASLLTHKCYEKKLKVKQTMVKVEEEVSKLGEAHSLYFDGTYKRKEDKAAVGVVIYDEEGRKEFGKGLMLENAHSNNEAKYAALSLGLEWCLNLGIKRLNAFEDALLLVKQVHGTWACKNQGLVVRLRRVKELLKRFEVAHFLHVPRKDNQEADFLASEQLQDVTIGAIALQQPQFQGSDCMPNILHFLETGECPKGLSKGKR